MKAKAKMYNKDQKNEENKKNSELRNWFIIIMY